VDSSFGFLSTAHADLLNEILSRRSPTLPEQVRQGDSVSRSDAEEIMLVIRRVHQEPRRRLEPTDYGQAVSAVLAKFNAAHVSEWP
jgi:hypothetical protein